MFSNANMAETGKDVKKALILLQDGEIIAVPTETVYGLAGNAFNAATVSKIFAIKNRPSFNPLITHTNHINKVYHYVQDIPKHARLLAEAFWPGPLTLLLLKTRAIPDIVTAGSDKVAVRIPRHPLTLQLLESLDFPLAAPSANPFGYVSPTRAEHVNEQLGDKIPYILDGGPCEVGIESTIVGFENEKVIIFRLGGISMEDLAEVVGEDNLVISNQPKDQSPDAPGMLSSHYAPGKKVIVGDLDDLIMQYDLNKAALISFKDYYPQVPQQRQFILSVTGNLNEAAQQLFFALREMDKLPVSYILAELVPDYGLGRAINDRLLRAAAENSKSS